jgi:glycerol dehydrogenase-like iron-containing ADH family enzyme
MLLIVSTPTIPSTDALVTLFFAAATTLTLLIAFGAARLLY